MPNDEIRQNRAPTTLSPESIPPSFTPAKTLAMAALLSGKSKTAAAQVAGVSRSTIHEWLASDPEFLAFFNSCRLEMIEAVEQSMLMLAPSAIKAIRILLSRRKTPDHVRLRAAAVVLKHRARAVSGPTDVEEAENAIAHRVKGKLLARVRAKAGLLSCFPEHRAILDRLKARDDDNALLRERDRPIGEYELDDEDIDGDGLGDEDEHDEEMDDEEELDE